MRLIDSWSAVVMIGMLGVSGAACVVTPDPDVESTTQAIEVPQTVPDLKMTIPDQTFDPWRGSRPRSDDPNLPPGWDLVTNGCNAGSDLGCQGFGNLGVGCDLVADGICRAYLPANFTNDASQFRWTCRCEKPALYNEASSVP